MITSKRGSIIMSNHLLLNSSNYRTKQIEEIDMTFQDKTLPRVVLVTQDDSRWLIDEDFIDKLWSIYCSDIERYDQDVEFDVDALTEDFEFDELGADWGDEIFPHARLVKPGSDLLQLVNHGLVKLEMDQLREWCKELIDGVYDDTDFGLLNYPRFQLATPPDLKNLKEESE